MQCWNDIPHLNKSTVTPRRVLERTSDEPQECLKENKENENEYSNTTPLAANHDYDFISMHDQYNNLEDRYNMLLKKCNELQDTNLILKNKLEKATFSVDSISNDAIKFYTGISNKDVFEHVLNFLNPGENCENITYVGYVHNKAKQPNEYSNAGRLRKLEPRNEFFYSCAD